MEKTLRRHAHCRFQRNTWLAFTPFARAIPATRALGSSVSFTILSLSFTRRNTRRFRPETTAPSMPPIVDCRSLAIQMGRPDAYMRQKSSDSIPESASTCQAKVSDHYGIGVDLSVRAAVSAASPPTVPCPIVTIRSRRSRIARVIRHLGMPCWYLPKIS